MRKIKLRYVGCDTARQHIRALRNTWLYSDEIVEAKELADSDATDEECEKHLSDLEDTISRRADFAISMF